MQLRRQAARAQLRDAPHEAGIEVFAAEQLRNVVLGSALETTVPAAISSPTGQHDARGAILAHA